MHTFSKIFKDRPINHTHTVPLDFSAIKNVPDSHAWTQSNDLEIILDNKMELGLISIPVIDLEDPNALGLIFRACEKWGMFQITNHGVSKKLLEQLEFQANSLFNLPLEQKMKVVRAPDESPGYGCLRISPLFSKLMWSEGFTIMGDSVIDHAQKLWPNEFQGFCDVIEEYQARMKELREKLMGLLLKSLNIPDSYTEGTKRNPSITLQLNSYPKCPDPTQTMGLAPHTDTSFLTILYGNASGFQVHKDGLGWVSVDPVPGALMVLIGDLFHIISNGRYPSALHRAVSNKERHRLSFAYFYSAPAEFQLSPFFHYSDCKGPCFRSLKMKEYVDIKFKYFNSALSYIKFD